jgi:hypothetical protein
MVMLSAMLAASVPVDSITRVATLGRGLAADRALPTGPRRLIRRICICRASAAFMQCTVFAYQPEVGSTPIRESHSLRSSRLHSPKPKSPI